jgi:two-component system response regulator HydG
VLVVDDDEAMCGMLETGLRGAGFETVTRTSVQEAQDLLRDEEIDVVVTDVRMKGLSGIDLCRHVAESRPDIPVIVVTAFGSVEAAIEAIRAGAHDFVTKPFDLDTIRLRVRRAMQHRQLRRRIDRLERALEEGQRLEGMVGKSPAMQEVYDLVERVAAARAPVLLVGESGTGKELVARAIHERSGRKGPLVAVNCAAIPEPLLESELFGHARGAFTDARSARQGLFLRADGGTLLLDEIGEMPLALQPKLHRALQERRVLPVGGDTEVGFDARVVAATNRDLEAAVEDGRFREDLYYRIHVIQIDVPPLRARGNDVLLLAQHFVEKFAAQSSRGVRGLLPAAAEKILSYPWPGNVRELQNCIERAVTLTRQSEISVEDLPEKVRDHRDEGGLLVGDDPADWVPLAEIERRYVLRVFEGTGRNKSLAARILGLNRKTLYRKLGEYGVLEGA